ncbi:hypothetical protein ALC57_14174 [Trachymyrmex cornetzi]|uniref:Uncharacterized protein n=1 Tax=Trachymyrmex cornetzi TaxID=471704 RepID=A0A151IYL9_9HYME|nr:hypothetical protein ALC57_14174 [Trachymyrmex cornetzi]
MLLQCLAEWGGGLAIAADPYFVPEGHPSWAGDLLGWVAVVSQHARDTPPMLPISAGNGSIVDLTWATPAATHRVTGWRVPTPSVNDTGRLVKERQWVLKKMNPSVLEASLLSATWPNRNPAITVKEEAEWLGDVMSLACDASMPRNRPMNRRAAYWRSEDLAELRRTTIAARRVHTRARRRGIDAEMAMAAEALRTARGDFRLAIRRAKAKAFLSGSRTRAVQRHNTWKELISVLDRDPWGRPYKIVTKKLRPGWASYWSELLRPASFGTYPGMVPIYPAVNTGSGRASQQCMPSSRYVPSRSR